MSVGRLSEVGPIKRMVLGHPRDLFADDRRIGDQWQALNYAALPDYAAAVAEYERFAALFGDRGIDISWLADDGRLSLDAIYVHDAVVPSPKGAILCNMGKAARKPEPEAFGRHLRAIGFPVWGAVTGEGLLEGGDVVWFDDRTLAVGRGYRTNDQGIRQLRALLGDGVDELVVVPLPHWKGTDDVFHLMSIISPLDDDLALVYAPLLPVPFREWLLARGLRLVEVAEEEFETLSSNVLALAPRSCVMVAGNPRTRRRLEAEGVEVREFEGAHIAHPGGGGPTCLTRPLVRG